MEGYVNADIYHHLHPDSFAGRCPLPTVYLVFGELIEACTADGEYFVLLLTTSASSQAPHHRPRIGRPAASRNPAS
jgi:hypothetical protein